jgi:hypothetical protein
MPERCEKRKRWVQRSKFAVEVEVDVVASIWGAAIVSY